MRLLHIACQPVSPNPLQGRAGFAIISITGVSHAYTGPIRSGNPVQWRIPCGVVIRLTFWTIHHYDKWSCRLDEHLFLCNFRHPTYEDGVVTWSQTTSSLLRTVSHQNGFAAQLQSTRQSWSHFWCLCFCLYVYLSTFAENRLKSGSL